jgi:hypothetical protein
MQDGISSPGNALSLIRVATLFLLDEQDIMNAHIFWIDWASVQCFALQKCRNVEM